MMTHNFILLDEKRKKTYVEEWHYMNLRDMDEEGNFIVSSWGQNYILRKADISGKIYFIHVKYDIDNKQQRKKNNNQILNNINIL